MHQNDPWPGLKCNTQFLLYFTGSPCSIFIYQVITSPQFLVIYDEIEISESIIVIVLFMSLKMASVP